MRTSAAAICLLVGACSHNDREALLGTTPRLSPVAIVAQSSFDAPPPVRTPQPATHLGSIVPLNSRSLFRDQRASGVGDTLTVRVNVADRAQFDTQSERNRDTSRKAGLTSFFGLEQLLRAILPSTSPPSALIGSSSSSATNGNGKTRRNEVISMTLAATVVRVLPNGLLEVQGRQEIRVDRELREVVIAGVVRPQDIAADNSILHTQIAEARVSYGGRGPVNDTTRVPWGQRILDGVSPF